MGATRHPPTTVQTTIIRSGAPTGHDRSVNAPGGKSIAEQWGHGGARASCVAMDAVPHGLAARRQRTASARMPEAISSTLSQPADGRRRAYAARAQRRGGSHARAGCVHVERIGARRGLCGFLPRPGYRALISQGGGVDPVWRNDGRVVLGVVTHSSQCDHGRKRPATRPRRRARVSLAVRTFVERDDDVAGRPADRDRSAAMKRRFIGRAVARSGRHTSTAKIRDDPPRAGGLVSPRCIPATPRTSRARPCSNSMMAMRFGGASLRSVSPAAACEIVSAEARDDLRRSPRTADKPGRRRRSARQ